jgi:Zn-dependent M32 family carboxypeptidase
MEEANACDNRIQLLKKELGKPDSWEFHFKENSHRIREEFLKAVVRYEFFYYSFIVNKKNLYSENLIGNKDSFYKYTCSLVFENAKDKLDNAIVLIDESGNRDFKKSLQKYLKNRMNDYDRKVIKKVKMQKSHTNNLLQLADYVAGVMNRNVLGNDDKGFRKIISGREIHVQIWPAINGKNKS